LWKIQKVFAELMGEPVSGEPQSLQPCTTCASAVWDWNKKNSLTSLRGNVLNAYIKNIGGLPFSLRCKPVVRETYSFVFVSFPQLQQIPDIINSYRKKVYFGRWF
jgi:hypothetical protein